jgi:hypothetical protein
MDSFFCSGSDNRRSVQLHDEEPVWLGPAAAAKKKNLN